jgi:hypothetical protein
MTMNTLPTIIAAVQDYVGAVSGVRMAPDVPTEQLPAGGVYAYVYPASGTFSVIAAGGREQGEHTLHLMLGTPRANMRTDWARVVALGDTVARALLVAGTMSGQIIDVQEVRYTFGDLEWGGQQLFGWMMELDVRLTGALS